MQTNLLRGALKRHALGASARLGGSSCTALRIDRSRGCSGRNLSSVVAVRDDDDDDDGTAAAATAAAVAHVRAAVSRGRRNQKELSQPDPLGRGGARQPHPPQVHGRTKHATDVKAQDCRARRGCSPWHMASLSHIGKEPGTLGFLCYFFFCLVVMCLPIN